MTPRQRIVANRRYNLVLAITITPLITTIDGKYMPSRDDQPVDLHPAATTAGIAAPTTSRSGLDQATAACPGDLNSCIDSAVFTIRRALLLIYSHIVALMTAQWAARYQNSSCVSGVGPPQRSTFRERE